MNTCKNCFKKFEVIEKEEVCLECEFFENSIDSQNIQDIKELTRENIFFNAQDIDFLPDYL